MENRVIERGAGGVLFLLFFLKTCECSCSLCFSSLKDCCIRELFSRDGAQHSITNMGSEAALPWFKSRFCH